MMNSQALVHVQKDQGDNQFAEEMQSEQPAIQGPVGPSVEELKRLEAAKKKLSKYKVVEKKDDQAQASKSLKDELFKA